MKPSRPRTLSAAGLHPLPRAHDLLVGSRPTYWLLTRLGMVVVLGGLHLAAHPQALPDKVGADGIAASKAAADNVAADTAVGAPEVDPEHLTLAAAELRARGANRELLAAQRRIESAQADRLGAQATPNPNLNVSINNYAPRNGLGSGSLYDKLVKTDIGVDQLIERGGKRDLRIRIADNAVKAARLAYQDGVRQQLQAVRTSYYDLLLWQESIDIIGQTARLYDETSEAAQRRLKAGDISQTDVNRIDVDRLKAQSDLQGALQNRNAARLTLAQLLAMETRADRIAAVDGWPSVDPGMGTSASAGAIAAAAAVRPGSDPIARIVDQRADVRAARARIDAAQANREYARSLRTRDVTVSVTLERDATQANASPPYFSNNVSVGISIPLLINNTYDGEIARSEADWRSAEDDLARTMGEARGEIALAASALATARSRSERYMTAILPTAQRTAEAYEFAFRRGALPVIDLLDARRTLRSAQLEAIAARADLAKALVAWQAATQVEPTP